jgi:hypothetical protein
MSPSTTGPARQLTATVVTPASCPQDGDRRNAARSTTNYASGQNLQSEFRFASSNAKSSSPPARRKPVHRPKKYRFTEDETAGEWKDFAVVDSTRTTHKYVLTNVLGLQPSLRDTTGTATTLLASNSGKRSRMMREVDWTTEKFVKSKTRPLPFPAIPLLSISTVRSVSRKTRKMVSKRVVSESDVQPGPNEKSRVIAIIEGFHRYGDDLECKQLWKMIKSNSGGRLDNRTTVQIKDKARNLKLISYQGPH